MSNKFKEIDTENYTYYCFDDMINRKAFFDLLHWIHGSQKFQQRKN